MVFSHTLCVIGAHTDYFIITLKLNQCACISELCGHCFGRKRKLVFWKSPHPTYQLVVWGGGGILTWGGAAVLSTFYVLIYHISNSFQELTSSQFHRDIKFLVTLCPNDLTWDHEDVQCTQRPHGCVLKGSSWPPRMTSRFGFSEDLAWGKLESLSTFKTVLKELKINLSPYPNLNPGCINSQVFLILQVLINYSKFLWFRFSTTF